MATSTPRTNVSDTWSTFFAHMEELVDTSGDDSTLAIRAVHEGEAMPTSLPDLKPAFSIPFTITSKGSSLEDTLGANPPSSPTPT